MGRFSHISDVHLGAFNDPYLRKRNIDSFIWALEKSLEENVDFIIISGDLFNTPIPDVPQITNAIKKMREIVERDIKIYAIYGSHDYSVTGSSIYSILVAAGIISDLHRSRENNGKIVLEPVVDDKTGAYIYGMYARKGAMESEIFEKITINPPPEVFKIFAFHSAISGISKDMQFNMPEIPISYIPKNMDYYAGGHIHERIEMDLPEYGKIVYPGPLFASTFVDLEKIAKGGSCGFYIVDFSKGINKIEFIENEIIRPELVEINANGKIPEEIMREAISRIEALQLDGRYLLLKIWGELSSGRTSEVDRKKLIEIVKKKNAAGININVSQLTSREFKEIEIINRNQGNIELEIFEKFLKQYGGKNESLIGERGKNIAISLLNLLRIEKNDNESGPDFKNKIINATGKIIGEEEWK